MTTGSSDRSCQSCGLDELLGQELFEVAIELGEPLSGCFRLSRHRWNALIHFDESLPAWERAFYAFLAEKERRSGSKRTVDAYSRTLQRFFGALGKPPDEVISQDVFVFAHGRGRILSCIGSMGWLQRPPAAIVRLGWAGVNGGAAILHRER